MYTEIVYTMSVPCQYHVSTMSVTLRNGIFFSFFLIVALSVSSRESLAQRKPEKTARVSATDRDALVATLRSVVFLVREVSRKHAAGPITDQLRDVTGKLSSATDGYGGFRSRRIVSTDDELVDLLRDIQRELRSVERRLRARDEDELADRLHGSIESLNDAVRMTGDRESLVRTDDESEWLAEGEYENGARKRRKSKRGRETYDDGKDDAYGDDDDWWYRNRNRFRRIRSDWQYHSTGYVGDFIQRWPYTEFSLYRPIPATRYNRVEGLVVGIRRMPVDWSSWDRGRIYGQVGYALSLDEWRYEAGAETRLTEAFGSGIFDLKIGGAYRRNTGTRDIWKSSWAENTLAASLFRTDFFDYFDTDGWTAYVVGRVTPWIQFSGAYREDTYRSLSNNTSWSLFGGDSFRSNPGIDEGEMKSLVFALEGGRIINYRHNPAGFTFRMEAEIGKDFGGDFRFNRYIADVRTYLRISRYDGLSLRLRGGTSEGNLPLQKSFTLGGVGSVRAYPQNVFLGSRMLLANVEYNMYNPGILDGIFDDLAIFGLFDAGWTNRFDRSVFSFDDVIPDAGLGVALNDREIRIEVAWPLRDMGTGTAATVWLRLNPTF